MKYVKTVLKGLFWLLIVAMLLLPLGLIFQISNEEMLGYQVPTLPRLQDTAYGGICKARREDVYEYVPVSGIFTSTAYIDQELSIREPGLIRWSVGMGDEIQEGQTIGTYKGDPILAELSGIILQMNTYDPKNCYIRVQSLTPLELECRVDTRTLAMLTGAENLTTKDSAAVTLTYVSKVQNPDGTTTVRMAIDREGYTFGQLLECLNIYTGKCYQRALVLDASCIYQKVKGENSPWYVRRVTPDGYFISEDAVKVGYTDGELVCVSDVMEGECFDSGYKAIAESGGQ